ncbi:rust resistance kinase Lr10-like isoform X2 [Asparagus officinalis]|uniref:rust resistance kinase Lr10-like isoform X1 n=2 Tax=Asparagus officinalis TaxID=4686 RepID=UPI00098E5031|nr:rust resistance kinase Lr10-like isoform X1 [Asparagus officinalis]XP_020251699.1 rust resistance kinase Lr10-like isoform X2 [Asparagus officinalis]
MKKLGAICAAFIVSYLFFISVGSTSGVEGKEICRSSCGSLHNISYPFRLKGDPVNCGDPSYELECDGNKTVVEILSGKYLVMNIFHENATIHIIGTGFVSGSCNLPIQSLSSRFIPTSYKYLEDQSWATFVNCSKKIENNIYRPIPCLSQNNKFVYVTSEYYVVNLLPSCSYLTMVPVDDVDITTTGGNVFQVLQNGFSLSWIVKNYTRSMVIHQCLRTAIQYTREDMYGFTKFKKITYPFQFEYEFVECIKKSWHFYDGASALYRSALVFIVFLDIAAFLLVLAILGRFVFGTLTIYAFLAYQLWNLLAPIDTVERFLRNEKALMPSRYAYTDIIAMTRHFKEKLGQGGFGAVYKGELPGGHLVAVKILGNSKCNGEEFTNEVATIGRIHHVNVVHLVGFCSEGSNRSLIYKFMCNGSLDKYIFSSNGSNKHFTIEKLNEIALGVARGLDYLHQGCDIRILHFDIKPHNVLLDQNFNPKLSDFGLAKLYPKENSLVSAFAARGTIGYMAPELVSRSFGLISYKSDVYSFGMLLLEMAGGRRNVDQRAENSSQVYYPSWIYHQLEQTEKLEFCNDIEIDNLERKLCKVGLWCIQMRAPARPSMSKVVEMLEADGDTIDMPPKPFLFSSPSSSTKPSSVHPSLTEITTIYEGE